MLRDVRLASALTALAFHTPITLAPLMAHGWRWVHQVERSLWLLLRRMVACKDLLFNPASSTNATNVDAVVKVDTTDLFEQPAAEAVPASA